jgi:hypothetical protein
MRRLAGPAYVSLDGMVSAETFRALMGSSSMIRHIE